MGQSIRCPKAVLPVYCIGATFELEINGSWRPPVTSITCGRSVLLGLAGHDALHVSRVRYAWADWPVNRLYSESGMPARLFNMPVEDDAGVAATKCPGGSLDVGGTAVAIGAVCRSHGDGRSHMSTATTADEAPSPPPKVASASAAGHKVKSGEPKRAPSSSMRSRDSSSGISSSNHSSSNRVRLGHHTASVVDDPRPASGNSGTVLTVSLIVSLVVGLPLIWVMSGSIVSCFERLNGRHFPLPRHDNLFRDASSATHNSLHSSASTDSKCILTPRGEKRSMLLEPVPMANGRRERRRDEEAHNEHDGEGVLYWEGDDES